MVEYLMNQLHVLNKLKKKSTKMQSKPRVKNGEIPYETIKIS